MKVLVTGSSGITGGHLVTRLQQGGFSVRVLLDLERESPLTRDLPLERFQGDSLDMEAVSSAVAGVQAVFNCDMRCACRLPIRKAVRSYNLDATRNVVVAMARHGVEDLVHVGTAFSFGWGTLDEPGDEDTPYRGAPFGLADLDAARQAQELALRYSDSGRLRCVVINPTLVLGPGLSRSGPAFALLESAARGRPLSPPGGVNVVGASDVADAALKALGRGRQGRCYIAGGDNLSFRQLLEKLCSAFGSDPPAETVAGRAFLTSGLLGRARAKISGKSAGSTPELARIAAEPLYYSSTRSARELSYSPRSSDIAIEEACDWFKAL